MLVGLVSSGRFGLTKVTVVGGFNLGGGEVAELAVEAMFVEPRHPSAGRDLEVVEASPVPSVRREDGGVAVQLGLVERVHRFGHRVVVRISDGPDRCPGVELGKPVGQDMTHNRPNACLSLGIDGALARLRKLLDDAIEAMLKAQPAR